MCRLESAAAVFLDLKTASMSQKKALINIERKIGSFCAFLKAKRADLLNFHLRQKFNPLCFLKSLLFGVELAEKSSVPPPPPPPILAPRGVRRRGAAALQSS